MSFTSPVLDHPNYPVTDVSYWMQGCLGPYAQLDSTDIVVGNLPCHRSCLPRVVGLYYLWSELGTLCLYLIMVGLAAKQAR
jgi:hypothetical protein